MLRENRLQGRIVAVVAGEPLEGELSSSRSLWNIDQAVISLARAVLAESGELVLIGSVAMGTLVAMVAGEYQEPIFAERGVERRRAKVRVYGASTHTDRERHDEAVLERLGLIARGDLANTSSTRPTSMLDQEDPAALICIGGGPDTIELALKFMKSYSERPVFVLASTGGGTSQLIEQYPAQVRDVESPIISAVRERGRMRLDSHFDTRREKLWDEVVPYPIIMQIIVNQIASSI